MYPDADVRSAGVFYNQLWLQKTYAEQTGPFGRRTLKRQEFICSHRGRIEVLQQRTIREKKVFWEHYSLQTFHNRDPTHKYLKISIIWEL